MIKEINSLHKQWMAREFLEDEVDLLKVSYQIILELKAHPQPKFPFYNATNITCLKLQTRLKRPAAFCWILANNLKSQDF